MLLSMLLSIMLPIMLPMLLATPAAAADTPAPTATPAPTPGSDQIHDRVCRKYLRPFLNGTTDGRDECQALLAAFDGAGCQGAGATDDDRTIDPWSRWWHDLLGDDDFGGGGDGDGDGDGGGGDDQIEMIDDAFENDACCSSIGAYYSVHCPADVGQSIDPAVLLIVSAILIACGVVRSAIRSLENTYVRSLPEAAGCILVGSAAAVAVRTLRPEIDLDRVTFDENLFLSIFLPPIIFQATLAIDKKALGRSLIPVLIFSIGGTVLSAILTGGMVHLATAFSSRPIPPLDAAVFGALISSVDPVATLGVLSAAGVGEAETIFVLVFGESLLNDGVAIVLFRSLVAHLGVGGGDGGVRELLGILPGIARDFVVVTAGSVAIGLLCGAGCVLYFWGLRGRQVPVVEVGIFFVWSLLPYYIGDDTGYSSVISMMAMLFFADIFVIGRQAPGEEGCNDGDEAARWSSPLSARGQLSAKARLHIGFVSEVLSSLMETIIFAYLGLFLFTDSLRHAPLSIVAIVSCVATRAAMVASLSWVTNQLLVAYRRTSNYCCNGRTLRMGDSDDVNDGTPNRKFLDHSSQLVLFLSGIRGAVSLALVENIPVYNAVTKTGSQYKAELKAMTVSSIAFTVFFFGSATFFLLNKDDSGFSRLRNVDRDEVDGSGDGDGLPPDRNSWLGGGAGGGFATAQRQQPSRGGGAAVVVNPNTLNQPLLLSGASESGNVPSWVTAED